MRRPKCSWLTLLLATGCFGDPPPSIEDTETTEGGSASGTAGDATASTGPGSADDPSTATADDTGGPTSGGDPTVGVTAGSATGSPTAECGDGMLETGELCFGESPTWERTFDGDIVDLALASIAGDPGDGGLLVLEAQGARFYSWAWDGFAPAGPTISPPFDLVGAPVFVFAADLDGEEGDELLVSTDQQVFRWNWDGTALLNNGPCAPPGTVAAVGQIDDDPANELLWVPGDAGGGLVPWLDLTGGGWCDGSTPVGGREGKPNALAIGPFWPGDPDDLARSLGAEVHVTEVVSPFDLGQSSTVTFAMTPTHLRPADLDGDGTPNELVIAGSPGVAAITTAGGATLHEVVPAGSVADLAVGDLDADGDDDVVVVDATAPTPLVLLSDGAGGFGVVPAPFSPGPSTAVDVADLDGDSAVDVVLGGVDGSLRAFLATP